MSDSVAVKIVDRLDQQTRVELLVVMELAEILRDIVRVILSPRNEHSNAMLSGCIVGARRALDRILPPPPPEVITRTVVEPGNPWYPISMAEEMGVANPETIIEVYCPTREGLDPIISFCTWHPDAGFCVDEIRQVTHFRFHVVPEVSDAK